MNVMARTHVPVPGTGCRVLPCEAVCLRVLSSSPPVPLLLAGPAKNLSKPCETAKDTRVGGSARAGRPAECG